MPRKKSPKTPAASPLTSEVDGICRLIDHCKSRGVGIFEGLGIKFGFRREQPERGNKQPVENGDEWIPVG